MTALLRWATAGCLGAVALAVVLVLAQPESTAVADTRQALERSGVRVIEPAKSSGDAFDDAGSSLGLAAAALAFGLVAGVVLGAAVDRVGHLAVLAAAGFVVSVAVLALVTTITWRDVGAQAAFWAVTGTWLWWSERGPTAGIRGSRPRP